MVARLSPPDSVLPCGSRAASARVGWKRSLFGLLLLLLCTLVAPKAQAQGILPADASTSFERGGNVDYALPHAVWVLSLEDFNAALAAAEFRELGGLPRELSRANAGWLNDRRAVGITSEVIQGNVPFSGRDFLVVTDARWSPRLTVHPTIEATDYVYVNVELSGTASWAGYGAKLWVDDTLPDATVEAPSACCLAAVTDGLPNGVRCVDAQGATTFSTQEAQGLSLSRAGLKSFYSLLDASAYGAAPPVFGGTAFSPVGLIPERCLACDRTDCCATSEDCPFPQSCAAGFCLSYCDTNSPCRTGARCQSNTCVAATCQSDVDCSPLEQCTQGSCVARACSQSADCPGGGYCAASNTCAAGCASKADCAVGQVCRSGVCEAGCDLSADCVAGYVCRSGQCAAGCDTSSDCAGASSCVGGHCLAPPGDASCLEDAACAFGESCRLGACVRTASVASLCRNASECPNGALCRSGQCVDAGGACLLDADCPPKQRCGATHLCTAPGALSGTQLGGPAPRPVEPSATGKGVLSPVALAGGLVGALAGREQEASSLEPYQPEGGAAAAVASLANHACPLDEELTVEHCLDAEFLASPCARRYREAVEGQSAPARPGLCSRLVEDAIAAEPKFASAHAPAEAVLQCDDVPAAGKGGAPAPAGGLRQSCRLVATGSSTPESVAYQQRMERVGELYRLDGLPLASRRPAPGEPVFSFSRVEGDEDPTVASDGGGSLLTRERTRAVHAPRDPRTRDCIEQREARWKSGSRDACVVPPPGLRLGGKVRLASCDEYVQQRFYSVSRFDEEANLLGGAPWAIWDLAYGPGDKPYSLGTIRARQQDSKLEDYLGRPLSTYHADPRFDLGALELYRGEVLSDSRYLKNPFFSPIFSRAIAWVHPRTGARAGVYQELLQAGYDAGHKPGWAWHHAQGQALRAHSLAQLQAVRSGPVHAFEQLRDAFHAAELDVLARSYGAIDLADIHARNQCFSCSCVHADLFFPKFGRSSEPMFQAPVPTWPLGREDWVTAERRIAGQVGAPMTCPLEPLAPSPALLSAVERLDDALSAAELAGYLDLEAPTPADWLPTDFSSRVRGLLLEDREQAKSLCLERTADDFEYVRTRFDGTRDAGDFLRDYASLERYFEAQERLIAHIPPAFKEGGDTPVSAFRTSDTQDISDGGFGVAFDFDCGAGLRDYTSPDGRSVALHEVQIDFDLTAGVTAQAFGLEIPLVRAGGEVHSDSEAQLPIVQVLGFDLASMSGALDALQVDGAVDQGGGAVGEFEFALEDFGRSFFVDALPEVMVYPGIYVSGGIVVRIGTAFGAGFDRLAGVPTGVRAQATPYAYAGAYLQASLDAIVASLTARATLIIVDFSLPVTGSIGLEPTVRPNGWDDYALSFDLDVDAQLEMLQGDITAEICVGLWPAEWCGKKTLFSWDALVHQETELLSKHLQPRLSFLDLAEAVRLGAL